MFLLPFRLHIKKLKKPTEFARDINVHTNAIKTLALAISKIAHGHLSSKFPDVEAQINSWAESFEIVIMHMPVTEAADLKAIQGRLEESAKFLRAADNSLTPFTGFELALHTGHDVFVPAGPAITHVIHRTLHDRNTFEGLPQTLDAIQTSCEYHEKYLTWLRDGMPERAPDQDDPSQDLTHEMARCPMHRVIYPKITKDDCFLFHDGTPIDDSDFETIDRLKWMVMTEYHAYLWKAGTLLSGRIALHQRYLDGRKRR